MTGRKHFSYYEDNKLMNLLNINDFSDFRDKYLNEMDESWKSNDYRL